MEKVVTWLQFWDNKCCADIVYQCQSKFQTLLESPFQKRNWTFLSLPSFNALDGLRLRVVLTKWTSGAYSLDHLGDNGPHLFREWFMAQLTQDANTAMTHKQICYKKLTALLTKNFIEIFHSDLKFLLCKVD